MPPPKLNFIDYTDEELDELSEITTQDIAVTHETIVDAVDKLFANLDVAEKQDTLDDA